MRSKTAPVFMHEPGKEADEGGSACRNTPVLKNLH